VPVNAGSAARPVASFLGVVHAFGFEPKKRGFEEIEIEQSATVLPAEMRNP
jgi:hypothetical protein